jgi:2-dehydropantoate 2-reductase
VKLIARGAQLEAIQQSGVIIECQDGSSMGARPEATDQIEAVADADVVFLTTKAHSIGSIAERLGQALPPHATLVTAQNGIPWWYFHRHGGRLDGAQVNSVDPDGEIPTRSWAASCIPQPSSCGLASSSTSRGLGSRWANRIAAASPTAAR